MVGVKEMQEILRNEYGISSPEQLAKAIRDMKKINVAVFTQPVAKKEIRDD